MIRATALTVALAALPGATLACERLTAHFEFCPEGTPWAAGDWQSGGDSDTLYLGKTAYEGFEDYFGSEKSGSLRSALTRIVERNGKPTGRKVVRDTFTTADLRVVRAIDPQSSRLNTPGVLALMIAEAGGARILLAVDAPPETPLADLDRLSRDFAALVRPKQDN